jgi:hypothetical protein
MRWWQQQCNYTQTKLRSHAFTFIHTQTSPERISEAQPVEQRLNVQVRLPVLTARFRCHCDHTDSDDHSVLPSEHHGLLPQDWVFWARTDGVLPQRLHTRCDGVVLTHNCTLVTFIIRIIQKLLWRQPNEGRWEGRVCRTWQVQSGREPSRKNNLGDLRRKKLWRISTRLGMWLWIGSAISGSCDYRYGKEPSGYTKEANFFCNRAKINVSRRIVLLHRSTSLSDITICFIDISLVSERSQFPGHEALADVGSSSARGTSQQMKPSSHHHTTTADETRIKTKASLEFHW